MSILIEDPEILAMVNKQITLGHFENPDEVLRSALSHLENGKPRHYGPFDGPWTEEKLDAALNEALASLETKPLHTSEEVFGPILAQYGQRNI